MACHHKLELTLVDASHLEEEAGTSNPLDYNKAWQVVQTAAGVIIPGDFGPRGHRGMIAAAKWARKKKYPSSGYVWVSNFSEKIVSQTSTICVLAIQATSIYTPFYPEVSSTDIEIEASKLRYWKSPATNATF